MIHTRKATKVLRGAFVALVLAHAACSGSGGAARPTPAAQDSPRWVAVSANDSVRILLDTGSVSRSGPLQRFWLGIIDVRGERVRAVAAPFLRFESSEEVDCGRGMARNLDMRVPDSAAVLHVLPADSTWKTFRQHALGPGILGPVCVFLDSTNSR